MNAVVAFDPAEQVPVEPQRLLVVGHGMVAQRFLEALQLADTDGRYTVAVLCGEPHAAYDRVRMTSYLAGTSAAELSLWSDDFGTRSGYRLHRSTQAIAIDREQRVVRSSDGASYRYDLLVLATGSYPFVPPIAGREHPSCFVYRTLDDLDAIRGAAAQARVGCVIGGGLLGLEAAKALHDLGLVTHVVEHASRLMTVQLDELGGRVLREKIEALGVVVHTSAATAAIAAGTSHTLRLDFVNGTALDTDIVVFSAGIRPNDALASDAGLLRGERGGIAVDATLRTSDPAIYAIGECAAIEQRCYGLVAPGYRMAEILADRLTGGDARFSGADMSTKLKLLGVDVGSIGDAQATTPGARSLVVDDSLRGVYGKLIVDAEGKHAIGAILVGDTSGYGTLHAYVTAGLALPTQPSSLLVPADAASMPAALPAQATVCVCNNVPAGALCDAIAAGNTSLGALKQATRAGTSCGGCLPLVKQLLDRELTARGEQVDRRLCAHFPHSRQELFHLVRSGELRSFDAVLRKHGNGLGCEICKPAVASILASCWNEHVLSPTHAATQDSNDYFLANIQRNGTYSVVPRIPGGEITPAKLIALGSVAQKFGLYTKITGGQRIDLFGARVEQLPAIWTDLIAAGFESGHAYGKALRTVKSCVGSTWCRYGMQDSVGMAIHLEERYRGLRSPHKLKLAVSGCTRECAEARGKDVGVIATERGWNLFVGGNGGAKPRHAELLASDLDDATLLRTIDRFLMFYVRTADRLQRTSTWMENIEGGIDYVRNVVCEDSLGIAAELEAAMQGLVDAYVCEWKVAVTTAAIRKRFRHFVNSGAGDDRIRFEPERGQMRPVRLVAPTKELVDTAPSAPETTA